MASSGTPLLLLSSGARKRYLEDVVRALALPARSSLQFRYDAPIISSVARAYLDGDRAKRRVCYVGFVDTSTPGEGPEIELVRQTTLTSATRRGSSFILRMEVGAYMSNARDCLEKYLIASELPRWKKDYAAHPDEPLDGFWVTQLRAELPKSVLVDHDPDGGHLEAFEATVQALCAHSEFNSTTRLFFNVLSIKDENGTRPELICGRWELRPATPYTLEIYHYYPDEGPHADRKEHWLVASIAGEALHNLSTEVLRADSEYDSKNVTFTTRDLLSQASGEFTIGRSTRPGDFSELSAEVNLSVVVEANIRKKCLVALMIFVGVALPGVTAVFAKNTWPTGLMAVIGGLLAGYASAFKLPKGL